MNSCDWFTDEVKCGSSAEVKNNLLLCRTHHNTHTVQNQIRTAAQVTKALDCNPDDLVYFLRLPNGNIKIGYTSQLPRRMQALTADFGGRLELIACTTGGLAKEQRLHNLFRDYRITEVQGEQFLPVPEILEYAVGLGVNSIGANTAVWYEGYTYTGAKPPKAEYRLAA